MADGSEVGAIDGLIARAEELRIPVTDGGLLRGDGVFEVVKAYGGRLFALDDHLERLERSAAVLRLDIPPRKLLEAEIGEVVATRGAYDGFLRIVLTRGGRRIVLTEPDIAQSGPLRVCFVTFEPSRVLDGVKSLSYGANWQATRLARERGFDEALLISEKGSVLEAPTASVFWAENEVLRTPPLAERILDSITRRVVLASSAVVEAPCTVDRLLSADEVFLASTSRELQPVHQVESQALEAPGLVTLAAQASFRSYVASRLPRAEVCVADERRVRGHDLRPATPQFDDGRASEGLPRKGSQWENIG